MALFASAAPARVQSLVPQQSLRGLKIGMVASQVRAVAGTPSINKIVSHPLLGKTRRRNERTSGGIGVGSSERALAAKLTGERCVTELGYRHCDLGKWSAGYVVTDFSISKAGRVTQVTLGLVID